MKQVIGLVLAAGLVVLFAMSRGGPRSTAVGFPRLRQSRPVGKSVCTSARDPSCATVTGAVVRVVDGDTVILRMNGRPRRVRLIGVDAPETWLRHDCFGTDAARALRRLIPPGSRVRAATDAETRDRYGRLLLYLWTARGVFVNAALIRAGFARTMTVPPNVNRAAALQEAERTARQARAGIWRACAAQAPEGGQRTARPPPNSPPLAAGTEAWGGPWPAGVDIWRRRRAELPTSGGGVGVDGGGGVGAALVSAGRV